MVLFCRPLETAICRFCLKSLPVIVMQVLSYSSTSKSEYIKLETCLQSFRISSLLCDNWSFLASFEILIVHTIGLYQNPKIKYLNCIDNLRKLIRFHCLKVKHISNSKIRKKKQIYVFAFEFPRDEKKHDYFKILHN